MVIINIICDDFINSIQDLDTNARGLIVQSREINKSYNKLRIGMSPILFVLFSVITFILMTVTHDAIQIFYEGKLILGAVDLVSAASLLTTLFNISSISETCFEALGQLDSYHR